MKILQVNCVYPKGSTGKITEQIHNGLLSLGEDSIVCYGRGEKLKQPRVYKTSYEVYAKMNNLISRITGLMYGGCSISTWYLIHLIKKEKPDIVHLQCINGYFVNIYKLLKWLNVNQVKTVVTLHAEFMYTANCGHAFECDKWMAGCGNCTRFKTETKSWFFDKTATSFSKMQDAFNGFKKNSIIISVSPWLYNRAIKSPIIGDLKQEIVYNGIDTSVFKHKMQQEIRRKYAYTEDTLILHVTAEFDDSIEHPKGGYYILELARRIPEFKFVIIAGNSVIRDELPSNVEMVGKIDNQNILADYYSLADLTVITSRREAFSMPCSESLCCGTPVIGFKAGAPEQIALSEYSEFVEYGDIEALEVIVRKWTVNGANLDRIDIAKKGTDKFSSEKMVQNYLEIYKDLI